MTGTLIFKMELFKFAKDKKILLSAGLIAVMNIVMTVFLIHIYGIMTRDDPFNLGMTSTETYTISVGVLLSVIMLAANALFALIFPFHMISLDYKNDVMALMVASGVNRAKLFLSKIGAVCLCSAALAIGMILVPIILVAIKVIHEGGMDNFLHHISSMIDIADISVVQSFISSILGYISHLAMISAACIVLKGSNLAFLLYIGMRFGTSVLKGFLGFFQFSWHLGMTGAFVYESLITLLIIAGFGYFSLYTMQHQNL